MAARLDIRRYPGFAAMTVLCLTILYVPLAVVMVYSFNDSTSRSLVMDSIARCAFSMIVPPGVS